MTDAAPLVQSILARLRNEARRTGRPFAELLELFAIERFLHRLGRSEHREALMLKGALLLRHWVGDDSRPTRDIDLVGPSGLTSEGLRRIFLDVISEPVEDDGIELEPGSLVIRPIRLDSPVGGLRAKLDGTMANVRLRYQVDVGLGDAVFPPGEEVSPGGLLGFPMSSIRAYTPYTVVAEKLESMIQLGHANTRFKDYFDLVVLPRRMDFQGPVLLESIQRTLDRRGTPVPPEPIDGLSPGFAEAPRNEAGWRTFVQRARVGEAHTDLPAAVAEIRRYLDPVLEAARGRRPVPARWPAGGPWEEAP